MAGCRRRTCGIGDDGPSGSTRPCRPHPGRRLNSCSSPPINSLRETLRLPSTPRPDHSAAAEEPLRRGPADRPTGAAGLHPRLTASGPGPGRPGCARDQPHSGCASTVAPRPSSLAPTWGGGRGGGIRRLPASMIVSGPGTPRFCGPRARCAEGESLTRGKAAADHRRGAVLVGLSTTTRVAVSAGRQCVQACAQLRSTITGRDDDSGRQRWAGTISGGFGPGPARSVLHPAPVPVGVQLPPPFAPACLRVAAAASARY